jgi:hypothetical protein
MQIVGEMGDVEEGERANRGARAGLHNDWITELVIHARECSEEKMHSD